MATDVEADATRREAEAGPSQTQRLGGTLLEQKVREAEVRAGLTSV